jgi:ABC-type hemin transport system ATPase subunit
VANQHIVIDLLREVRAAGTTVMGVFHDQELVDQLADRYLLLCDGRLVADGASADVLSGAVPALP